MDKKSTVFRSLGPTQDFGLEKEDPTFGMDQPSLEGNVHSPNPGPDRPKPELQEMLVESYGDDVPDYMADIMRGLELKRQPSGGVVVTRAPQRMASEDKVNDSVYKKIVSAMRRSAEEAERKAPAAEEQEAEPTEEYSAYSSPDEAAAALAAEQERIRQEQDAAQAAEREQARADIDKQYGKPEEETRQRGPKEDVGEAKYVEIAKGQPGYDTLVQVSEKIFDVMQKQVELMDKYITESEFIFRWNRALRDSFKAARDANSQFYKKHKLAIEKVAPLLDQILSSNPDLKKVQVGGEAGTAARTKSVRKMLSGLKLEDVMAVVMDPKALEGAVEGLKQREEVSEEGPRRAADLEKLVKNNGAKLKDALEMALKLVQDSAKDTMNTSAKLSGLSAKFAPSAKEMMTRYKKVLDRAEKYNQDIVDIASKYKVSDEELAMEKAKLESAIAKLQSAMQVAKGFAEVSGGDKQAAADDAIIRIAKNGSWAEAVAEADEISFEAEEAIADLGEVPNFDSAMSATLAANEAVSGGEEALGEVEAILSAMSGAGAQAPADAPAQAEDEPAESSWYDKLMEKVMPQQEMGFAPAMAAADLKFLRDAVKGKEKKNEPAGFADLETDPDKKMSPEELAKQPLSVEELSKAKLPKDKALEHQKRQEKREDSASAKPSAEAKRAKNILQKAADAMAESGLDQASRDAFVESRQMASEASKKLREGLEAGREAMRAAEAEAEQYKAQRGQEEGGEEVLSHRERLTDVERQMAAAADELLSLNEEFAAALRSAEPKFNDSVEKALVVLGDSYQWMVDMTQKEAVLNNPGLAEKIDASLPLILKSLKSKYKGDPVAKEKVALLKEAADLMANVGIKFGSRSSMRHSQPLVEKVEQTMKPAVDKGIEQIQQQAPEVAEPLLSDEELAKRQVPPAEGGAQAAGVSDIVRTAESDDAADKELLSEMKDLAKQLPKATKEASALGEMSEQMVALAEDVESAMADIRSAEAEPAEEEGMSWDKIKEMGRGVLDKIRDGLAPEPALEPAMVAAKQADGIERTAGEYDDFDQSKNRLDIVEGEDGKRKLVINKGLKGMVSKKVHDMAYGGYKCGDEVQVDMEDFLGHGVVKAYLGNAVYRVECEGSIMEVPAKHIFGLENPWR